MNIHIIGFLMLLAGCTSRDTIVDKSKLLSSDYRIFQQTPAWELAKAVQDGDVSKMRQEIKRDKNLINYQEKTYKQSLLSLAVYNENYKSVNELINLGANPNLQNNQGDSPLMNAAEIGMGTDRSDPRYLKLLLEHGGDANAEQHGLTKTRQSPLMIACENGKFDYIKLLVSAGAKVNAVNEYGDSPLESAMTAVSFNADPDIVTYLIARGADFRRVFYKTIPEGESKYITDELRWWRFELGSDKYKKKMRLVDFLKKNGMDYWKTEIPENFLEDYPKDYLKQY